MIVTTSRKPVPELRSLAKDFAFAAGCPYVLRGRMGLPDIASRDPVSFIFSSRGREFFLRLSDHGKIVVDITIPEWDVEERSGERLPSILVEDPSLYERLAPYIPVKLSETGGGGCLFDGTRKRRYLLRLVMHEA